MRGTSVVIALMATLLAVSVLRLDAAEDKPLLSISTDRRVPEPCCDLPCACTLPYGIPPICVCGDVKDHCYPGCKACACTKSIPPQCSCRDVLDYCPGACPAVKSF